MIELVSRSLRLFFAKRSTVLFSLLAAIISVVLYLVFLKNSMSAQFAAIPQHTALLDLWLIGGTLGITAVTTTGHALALVVNDKENGVLADLLLTDVTGVTVQMAYAVAAVVIGWLMQGVVFVGLAAYFNWRDGLQVAFSTLPALAVCMLLNAILWTALNLAIVLFVRKMGTLSTLNSLIGTAAGFFVGVYMPIGLIPATARQVIKLTPAPYSASLCRQILMAQPLRDAFAHTGARESFAKLMGVGIDWQGLTTVVQDGAILIATAMIVILYCVIFSRKSQLAALQRG